VHVVSEQLPCELIDDILAAVHLVITYFTQFGCVNERMKIWYCSKMHGQCTSLGTLAILQNKTFSKYWNILLHYVSLENRLI
jgi:hypothetical protein